MITAEVIKELNSSDLSFVSRGIFHYVDIKVLPPRLATYESLVFVSKADQQEVALKAQSPIIIAHKNLKLPSDLNTTLLATGSIQLAMATILPLFDGKTDRFNQEMKIHPTASIHPSAHLGKNIRCGVLALAGLSSQSQRQLFPSKEQALRQNRLFRADGDAILFIHPFSSAH